MTQQWPEIIPLGQTELPAFPTEALPEPLRSYTEELAETYQVPEDLPGMLMLAAAATPCARRFKVKAGPDWSEPCNLYTVVALPPAHRKSAVFSAVMSPIEQHERDITKQAKEDATEARLKRGVLESRLKALKSQAAKASAEEVDGLIAEISDLESNLPDVPTAPRILADDVSPEKLASLLAENDGQLALMSAEGGVFDLMAGRYSSGAPNLDVYLKGHAGDSLRVDRIGREPDFVESPALTIGLAVQPDVIRGLADKPGFKGRGLLGRFLYSLPKSMLGHRKIHTTAVHPGTRANYVNTLSQLLRGAEPSENQDTPVIRYLVLEPEAQGLFSQYRQRIERELGPGGVLESATDWGGKLPGAVARIAGILHAVQYPQSPADHQISRSTLESAIELGDYLLPHALATFQTMGAEPGAQDAEHVLHWIRRNEILDFSAREAFQALKGGRFARMIDLEPAIGTLVDHGFIARLQEPAPKGPGRKPSPRYQVNPATHPQNTHKRPATLRGEDYEDIGGIPPRLNDEHQAQGVSSTTLRQHAS